ncbi:MAG: biopolymer transporter ExbD [Victivallales bacterium]|nr:biopolymer transporter ExbD [Victivallales bacterium]
MLLIIFIITVPALEYVTDFTPEMETGTTENKMENKVYVILDKEGIVKLSQTENESDARIVPMATLSDSLRSLKETNPEMNLIIKAAKERPFGEVVELQDAAGQAKIMNVFYSTSPKSSQSK